MRVRLAIVLLCAATPLAAATFTVTNTSDAGAGECETAVWQVVHTGARSSPRRNAS